MTISLAAVLLCEEPGTDYRSAFLRAIDEYNDFGAAVFSAKLRVDPTTALNLYGLKVS